MIPSELIETARAQMAAAFCNSTGQVLGKSDQVDAAGRDLGLWTEEGDSFACSLYSPKGVEVPQALSNLEREIYWLAYVGSPSIDSTKRVVVGPIVYDVHTTEQDRTTAILCRAMVSRLGPFIDADTGYPATYPERY